MCFFDLQLVQIVQMVQMVQLHAWAQLVARLVQLHAWPHAEAVHMPLTQDTVAVDAALTQEPGAAPAAALAARHLTW